jgi:predicted RNase H-like HicB family nuclease
MTQLRYLVRIDKDDDSDWGASVPDLPGCIATARTLDGVVRRIRAAIELHLHGLREDGEPIPRPRVRTLRPTVTRKHVVVFASVAVAA